jgi:hypothetical protein
MMLCVLFHFLLTHEFVSRLLLTTTSSRHNSYLWNFFKTTWITIRGCLKTHWDSNLHRRKIIHRKKIHLFQLKQHQSNFCEVFSSFCPWINIFDDEDEHFFKKDEYIIFYFKISESIRSCAFSKGIINDKKFTTNSILQLHYQETITILLRLS